MINLKALVTAIYGSVISANESLQKQNTAFIDQFFEHVDDGKKNKQATKGNDTSSKKPTLRPKYVTLEYPTETAEGMKTVGVDVPLISVVPISTSRIKELVLRTGLEVEIASDGELMVSFEQPKSNLTKFEIENNHNETSSTHLEIKISGDETPEGLRKLIEGYDRALRSQIPG